MYTLQGSIGGLSSLAPLGALYVMIKNCCTSATLSIFFGTFRYFILIGSAWYLLLLLVFVGYDWYLLRLFGSFGIFLVCVCWIFIHNIKEEKSLSLGSFRCQP